jgi:hypothetical protein
MTNKEKISECLRNKKLKLIISALCIWSFINTYLIIRSYEIEHYEYKGLKFELYGKIFSRTSMFYPFTNDGRNSWFDVSFYDFTEYFVYVGGVWMIYFLYRFLKKQNSQLS